MFSSIRRSDPGLPVRCAALAVALALLVLTHAGLEISARFAERRLGAFLWKQQDYLRLFEGANYVGQGRSRLLIYGPSEAREGILPEELQRLLPDLRPYQHSQSIGTLEDGLLVLNYIEKAYGRSAIPEAILLGITPRFVGNIRLQQSPLQHGIGLYSPHFRLEGEGHPPTLVPKTGMDALRARFALLGVQPDRYRRGLFAIASGVLTTAVPSLASHRWTWGPIRPAKYLVGRWRADEAATKRWLVEPDSFWRAVHAWEPEQSRERVIEELRSLLAFAARYGSTVYVVNLPELSWVSELFRPGRYEAYLALVKEAIGDTPFLDLRTFLADGDFFDDAHPVWTAGIRVSHRIGEFIAEHRPRGPAAGSHR